MNEINKNQNKENMLMLQFAARQHYNRAERFAIYSWILCVLVIFFRTENVSQTYGVWSPIIIMFISLFLNPMIEYSISHNIRLGSAARQLFDYKLFLFPMPKFFNGLTEKEIVDDAALEKNRTPNKYDSQTTHTGEDKKHHGLRDWYNVSSDIDHNSAVKKCQSENDMFDNMLVNTLIVVFVTIVLIVSVIMVMIYGNKTVNELVFSLFAFMPLFAKVNGAIKKYIELAKGKVRWKQKLCYENTDIKTRQECIDERRRMNFIVPNWLYSVLSHRMHQVFKDSNM